MMAGEEEKDKDIVMSAGAHVLVIPHPAQGHMIPILDLAHHLSTRGLTITVLVTPKNLPLLSSLPSAVHTLVLPFPNSPSVPSGVENVKDLPPGPTSFTAAIVRALSGLRDPIVRWFRSHPDPPVAIVSDFFLGWTEGLARQLGVPRIVFYCSGAFLVSVLNALWSNDGRLDPTASFEYRQLPSIYRRCEELGSPGSDWEFMKEGMIANMGSWGAIYNTFASLERPHLEHMSSSRTWAVGPLFIGSAGPTSRGGPNSAIDVLAWLDTCDDRSVVYVCFGSEVMLTTQQMNELAAGLEASGVRFVWAVKVLPAGHSSRDHSAIPVGFEERVAGRGMIIKGWAPQVAILKHRAVGSFLTHCGWNSVLEGLAAGVTLLTWPMGADQFVNARLLVEELGVAVGICQGLETVPDSAELSRAVANSLGERIRAMELNRAAVEAVEEGGSSYCDLDGLVKELISISVEKKNSEKGRVR